MVFFQANRIKAWLEQQELLVLQEQQLVQKLRQRQGLRLEQQEQQELLVLQQQLGLLQEQELLLFYRKQPKQQQRSQLPKREICSFLKTKVSDEKFPEIIQAACCEDLAISIRTLIASGRIIQCKTQQTRVNPDAS